MPPAPTASSDQRQADQFPSGQPLYLHITAELQRRIEAGEWREGQALPNERDLAAALGVSRATVRRALAALADRQLLRRRQGSGTFVSGRRIERDAQGMVSFTEDILGRGWRPGSQVLGCVTRPATPPEAQALALGPRASVHLIERLRTANGEAISLEHNVLPAALCGPLRRPDVDGVSLSALLAARGLVPERAVRKISAGAATPEQARLLGLGAGEPVLQTVRTSWLPGGRPLEFARAWYAAGRYDFVMELRPVERS